MLTKSTHLHWPTIPAEVSQSQYLGLHHGSTLTPPSACKLHAVVTVACAVSLIDIPFVFDSQLVSSD